MAVQLVYETHSLSIDNERGIATGRLPGALSERGRLLAQALGERRRDDGIACVLTSDLRRAVETADIAFEGRAIERRQDPRLRECDYGELNGAPVEALEPRLRFVDAPFPGGESYRDCCAKMRSALDDIVREFDGRGILMIAHSSQRFGLRHLLEGVPLEDLVDAPFGWQEGWEYVMPSPGRVPRAPDTRGRSVASSHAPLDLTKGTMGVRRQASRVAPTRVATGALSLQGKLIQRSVRRHT